MDSTALERLRALLAAALPQKVVAELRKATVNRLTPKLRADFADLARQAGAPELALRWLAPGVRPTLGRKGDASPREIAVYAASLIKLGATEEALGLLRGVDPKDEPESLLFLAHAHISKWDYAQAIPPLVKLLEVGSLPKERRLVAHLNLLASFIVEDRYEEAEPLLVWLEEATSQGSFAFHQAITTELGAQLALKRKDWQRCEAYLRRGEQLLASTSGLQAFFLRKWRLNLDIKRAGEFAPFRGAWERLRDEGARLRHWESLRDLDHLKACETKDESLLLHLYFGTPFESFRERLFLTLKAPLAIPEAYPWALHGGGGAAWDLWGFIEGRGLKPWSNHTQLLGLLTSDFYRPFRVGMVHASLFPGEHFNPDSSPPRVYQAFAELRRFLKSHRAPVTVATDDGGYHLAAPGGKGILVPRPGRWKHLDPFDRVRSQFEGVPFSASDVAGLLTCSRSTATRLIREGLKEGSLVREGSGPDTRYYFASSLPGRRAA